MKIDTVLRYAMTFLAGIGFSATLLAVVAFLK